MVSELPRANAQSMANSSSSASSSANPPTDNTSPLSTMPTLSQLFKLEGPNYLAWVSQFQPILRGNDLQGLVDGTDQCPPQFIIGETNIQTANPAYVTWKKKDQLLLSWIISSLAPTLVSSMYGVNTSYQAWTALATKYASQSKSRISHLKRQLQNLQQGNKTCTEYLNMAKQWADKLSAAGKPVEDDDLISYVISGLNPLYNTFVTVHSFTTQDREMSFADFQTELLNHEMLLDSQQQQTLATEPGTFAFYTNKAGQSNFIQSNSSFRKTRYLPRPNSRNPQFAPRNNSAYQPFPPRNNTGFPVRNRFAPNQQAPLVQPAPLQNRDNAQVNPATPRPTCQICGKSNHSALDCYHRMDYSYQGRHPPGQLAAMVAQLNEEFGAEKWLADSGANAHITPDAANIHEPQPFEGQDMVGVGNGTGLSIKNFGSSFVQSSFPKHLPFLLKDVLHCHNASANLLSINKFCIDNNCWFALTGSNFTVKDNLTGRVLLQGPSENGLYPIPLHQKSLNKWKGFAAYVGVKTTDLVWHQRLGHPSSFVIQHLLRNQKLPFTGSFDKSRVCEACQLGKSKQLPFSNYTRCTLSPLELIHSDVWTSPIPSVSGCRYYVIFVDDYSRFTWLYPLLSKSEVYGCFVKFKLLAENLFSTKIKQFQSDNGGEYTSNQFKHFLSQKGILHSLTCPHTSQQNGVAERKHRHVLEVGLTLLAQSGLSSKYWVDSFLTAIFLINRLPSPVLQHDSPFSKLMKRAPNYTILRTFGCLCYPLLRPYANHKLSFRSKPCIFIGYGGNQKGYRCPDPTTNKVYLSRSVIFDETHFPAKSKSISQGSCKVTASSGESLVFLPSSSPGQFDLPCSPSISLSNDVTPSIDPAPQQIPSTESTSNNALDTATNPTTQSPSLPSHQNSILEIPATDPITTSPETTLDHFIPTSDHTSQLQEISSSLAQPANRILTRSQTGTLKPKHFPGFKLFHTIKYPISALLTFALPQEPSTYKQAASHPEWTQAMLLEYNALVSNQTWTLCPRPSHRNVVRNKWVFKIKQKPDGSVDRFKARLVAKGFDQLSGVDYYEIFSPVIKPSTIRLILALAVQFDWKIQQLDVSNAFLHGVLDEEVYMEQPQGFVDPNYADHVCKLNKSIYGLKQAPRAWFTRLSQALLNLGFCGSQVDHSLFIYHLDSVHVFLLVYVDDIILTGNHEGIMNSFIAKLKTDFSMKDLGSLGYFL